MRSVAAWNATNFVTLPGGAAAQTVTATTFFPYQSHVGDTFTAAATPCIDWTLCHARHISA